MTLNNTMGSTATILTVSDIHYASAAERERAGYEFDAIDRWWMRQAVHAYRHFIWKRDPFDQNHLLDRFLACAGSPDLVVANGDYSCDTGFVGISDPAAYASADQCLNQLRARFGSRLRIVLGDHELGKQSLVGCHGGLRLKSLAAARTGLGVTPFWRHEMGRYVLLGVTSSLVALPVFEPETLPEERDAWREERECHLAMVRQEFERLEPERRVILFCHDPTALPFLWAENAVRDRLDQVALTVVGHLHSELILWQSGFLAGMPVIRFLGNAVRRMTTALREARCWRPFRVRLCPALSGIELLKDGGYARIELELDSDRPVRYEVCRWGKGVRGNREGEKATS